MKKFFTEKTKWLMLAPAVSITCSMVSLCSYYIFDNMIGIEEIASVEIYLVFPYLTYTFPILSKDEKFKDIFYSKENLIITVITTILFLPTVFIICFYNKYR